MIGMIALLDMTNDLEAAAPYVSTLHLARIFENLNSKGTTNTLSPVSTEAEAATS